jgi:VWFA-related protein
MRSILAAAAILAAISILVPAQKPTATDSTGDGGVHRPFGWSLVRQPRQPADQRAVVASKPITEVEQDVVKVDTNLVVSEILVLDRDGKSVNGLKREHFRVEEDGRPQEIEVFATGGERFSIARSIVLVIDYSGSQLPYIETSIEAAKTLVGMLNDNDRLAIVTDDVELIVNFTSDKDLLKRKLDSLKWAALSGKVGKSRQFRALMAAMNELFREGDLRPSIIFQTDGDEYPLIADSRAKRDDLGSMDLHFKYRDVLAAAERAGTTIYTIIPGLRLSEAQGDKRLELALKDLENSSNSFAQIHSSAVFAGGKKFDKKYIRRWADARSRDADAIARLAESTSGWSTYLESPGEAQAVYARILAEMNQRYVIGYYPSNHARDGKRRSLRYILKTGSDHRIRARRSYIAPGPTE